MSYEYPSTPIPSYPYDISIAWKTITSAFDSGKEQRRQKNLYPKYSVTLSYDNLSATDVQTLWSFYQARRGTYEPFYFYSFDSQSWTGNYIGIGDAATVTFDLPGKSTSATVIYKNGVVVAAADYTLLTGGGDCSADRVTFDTAPALNDLITCDFTGLFRIRCRFAEELTRTNFEYALYRTGIKLQGLANV